MTDYKIIKMGDDFYIAHEDFRRDAWQIDAKLETQSVDRRTVVDREGEFIDTSAEMEDFHFRFGPGVDDNYVSIDGSEGHRVPWSHAKYLMRKLLERQERREGKVAKTDGD